MDKFSTIVSNVYALLLVAGGIFGFVKAHSMWSLVTGIIFGLLIFISTNYGKHNVKMQYFSNALFSLIVAFIFLFRFMATHSFMPAGLMLILSTFTFVVVGMGWLKNK